MSPTILLWLQFALCVGLIGIGGTALSRYGDVIAEKTGMGGTWIGLILLATVTSLPELVTGLSAVTVAHAPNIAVGDVLGSCVFNLAIIVVVDFLHRKESIYTRARQGHVLAASFGVILIGLVGFSLFLSGRGAVPAIAHIGLYTPAILFMYGLAMRAVYRYEQREMAEYTEDRVERYPGMSLRQAGVRYALAACVVMVAAIWLPFLGTDIARAMGWHNTFVGTLFIAAATSVPELVVTIAAVRIGALDMALANLFGSNLFNIAILAVDDIAFVQGPLLSHVATIHAVTALSAVIMSGIAAVGLLYRPAGRVLRGVGWISLFLLSVYLLNTYLLFLYGE